MFVNNSEFKDCAELIRDGFQKPRLNMLFNSFIANPTLYARIMLFMQGLGYCSD